MDKLNFEEFFDFVWNEYVSERVVPNSFFDGNKELITDVTYDVYHVYKQQQNLSESVFAKIIEQVFRNVVRTKIEYSRDNSVNEAYESFD